MSELNEMSGLDLGRNHPRPDARRGISRRAVDAMMITLLRSAADRAACDAAQARAIEERKALHVVRVARAAGMAESAADHE